MKVSIVIPYYNDREFLPQAIESVLNQSFEDFELILVNHATTDDCREIAHSYKDSRIVHFDMEKNYGAGTGLVLRRVLKFAKGEYMKFFCADDILYKDGLKTLVDYMDSHPEKDFAFGNVEFVDLKGKPTGKDWFKNRPYFSLSNNEIKCLKQYFNDLSFLPYIGSIIRTKILKTIEVDVSLISYFDVNLWINLLIKGYKIGYIDKYIAQWRIHKGQMSSTSQLKKLNGLSEFEKMKNIESFFKIDNVELLKNIFDKNYFIQEGIEITSDDIKFIVSYELLLSHVRLFQYVGYNYIYTLLHDDDKRKYIEEKFGFGIKEFRRIYTTILRGGLGVVPLKILLLHLSKKIIRMMTLAKIKNKKNKLQNA